MGQLQAARVIAFRQCHGMGSNTIYSVGQQGEILAFQGDKVATGFLNNEGLHPGVVVQIEAKSSSGAILVRTAEKRITITGEIAEKVKVRVAEVIKTYAA